MKCSLEIIVATQYVCGETCGGLRPLHDSSNRVVCRYFGDDVNMVPSPKGLVPHRTFRCQKADSFFKKEAT